MTIHFNPRAPLKPPAQSASVIADGRGLSWAHAPSALAWSVMCFGGKNPRTGEDQPNLEVQFHKRTAPAAFGLGKEGILYRANDYAQMQHRSHVAVRDVDGSVIYSGPVLNELDAPGVFNAILADDFLNVAKGQRAFARQKGSR